MHWVRLRLKFGTAFGLLALTLQLLISFGHVHSYGASATPIQASSLPKAGADKIAPTDRDELPGSDDFCAVCALIHLSGSALHHNPPALHLLQSWMPATHVTSLKEIQLETVPARFQARAPPVG